MDNAENPPNENPAKKWTQKSRGLYESPCKEGTSDSHRNFNEETRQSHRRSSQPSRGGKKIPPAIHLTETEPLIFPENVNSPRFSEKRNKMKTAKFLRKPVTPPSMNSSPCLSSSTSPDDTAAKFSKETFTPLGEKQQRTPCSSRLSLTSLGQSVNLSGSTQSFASNSAGDDVFEDYFSPAHNHQKTKRHLLPELPVEGSIHMPFELDSVLKKRKRRRCQSNGSATKNSKKKKPEENDSIKNQQVDAGIEIQSDSRYSVEGSPWRAISNVTYTAEEGRHSTLPIIRTTTSDATKQRRASTSLMSKFVEKNTSSHLQKSNLSCIMESK